MRLPTLGLSAILCASPASGAAVFAHFMVGNAQNYSVADWQRDIGYAQTAHIDAFALNIAYGDDTVAGSLENAFQAVQGTGFGLFFSFDYAGGIDGPWPQEVVLSYANQYFGNSGYYRYNGQPFVSTFEGPDNAADWILIKQETGCFFVPDWSSKGADAALGLAGGGIVDGLFSWAAWPWGGQDMTTYVDASYYQFMNKNLSYPDPGVGLPYMMAVSPWFFTNLPGYSKNWLWRGDDLWYDRWVEVIYNEPEFVEIISWNDYGESHYIGPIYDYALDTVIRVGKPPYNYVAGMDHDGWRKFLPFVIDTYKTGTATVTKEGLVGWYRTSPGTSCDTGDTTGNTASQLQIEFPPSQLAQDRVFFSALLGSAATVSVSIGGSSQTPSWTHTPDGGIGIYHGSVPFNGVGSVVIMLSRGGTVVAEISGGPAISNTCTDGITNWNAWVGEADGGAVSATPTLPRSKQTCINGTGLNNFQGLCEFACMYGYCPISACVCLEVGAPLQPSPAATHPIGYPIAGEDASYEGLCAFDCLRGHCPASACGTVSVPLTTPTVSDFSPPACVAGQVLALASGNLAGLCSFACGYGYCPMQVCECTAQGALVDSNHLEVDVKGAPVAGLDDYGLCAWSCSHNYCPPGACVSLTPGAGDGLVYLSPDIWIEPHPTVGCFPPCTLLFPPLMLPTPISVTWPPYASGLYQSSGTTTITTTTVISIPPFAVSSIPFWPVVVNGDDPTTAIISPLQSVTPPPLVIPIPSSQAPISVTTVPGGRTGTTDGITITTPYFSPLPPTWGLGSITVWPMPTISVQVPSGDVQMTTLTTTTTSTGSGGVIITTGVVTTTAAANSQTVSYSQGSDGGGSTSSGDCGHDCGKDPCNAGCGGGCGPAGCDGGCGIRGCGGGGCGIRGCGGWGWGDGGGGDSGGNCGPAGCGCSVGCRDGGGDGNGGTGGCEGPDADCTPNNPDGECDGSDEECACDATKTVTSCNVLCTQTVALTTTITGDCSTTACATKSCGMDTTATQTTTTTLDIEVDMTTAITDTAWTEDLSAAYATSVYDYVLSWWSVESAAASSTPTTTTTTTTSSSPLPSGVWQVSIYENTNCGSLYPFYPTYVISGTTSNQCIDPFNNNLPTTLQGSGQSCRHYTDATAYEPCTTPTNSPEVDIESWEIIGGSCVAYYLDDGCSASGSQNSYKPSGCEEYQEGVDIAYWALLSCSPS